MKYVWLNYEYEKGFHISKLIKQLRVTCQQRQKHGMDIVVTGSSVITQWPMKYIALLKMLKESSEDIISYIRSMSDKTRQYIPQGQTFL